MYRGLTSLLCGVAALSVIASVADARDGCGRGRYYNGYRCAPDPDYYGPPRGPQFQIEVDRNDYRQPRSGPGGRLICPPRYTVQDGVCKPYTGR